MENYENIKKDSIVIGIGDESFELIIDYPTVINITKNIITRKEMSDITDEEDGINLIEIMPKLKKFCNQNIPGYANDNIVMNGIDTKVLRTIALMSYLDNKAQNVIQDMSFKLGMVVGIIFAMITSAITFGYIDYLSFIPGYMTFLLISAITRYAGDYLFLSMVVNKKIKIYLTPDSFCKIKANLI